MEKRIRRIKDVEHTEIGIYKLSGISQYVLRSGSHEVNFVLEEDAQRFARYLSGRDEVFQVHDSVGKILSDIPVQKVP